jgi:hypothetical protein
MFSLLVILRVVLSHGEQNYLYSTSQFIHLHFLDGYDVGLGIRNFPVKKQVGRKWYSSLALVLSYSRPEFDHICCGCENPICTTTTKQKAFKNFLLVQLSIVRGSQRDVVYLG